MADLDDRVVRHIDTAVVDRVVERASAHSAAARLSRDHPAVEIILLRRVSKTAITANATATGLGLDLIHRRRTRAGVRRTWTTT